VNEAGVLRKQGEGDIGGILLLLDLHTQQEAVLAGV
jgi:hypothetical protein